MVKSKRIIQAENLLNVNSTALTEVGQLSYAVRKHGSIENQLHGSLDVLFLEEDARAEKDVSPLNLKVLRKDA